MTSKRMLLQGPDLGYRLAPASVLQTYTWRENAGSHGHSFGVNTTPGNFLVFAAVGRQGIPSLPNEETWTEPVTGIQFQRTTTTDENGVRLATATCTGARMSFSFGAGVSRSFCMWEVQNAAAAGMTVVSASDHAASPTLDLGSLVTPTTAQLALMVNGNGADLTAEVITPGVWSVDWFANRDVDSNYTNSLPGGGGFPCSWFGHAQGAGVALEASLGLDSSQKYGGIAVLLA